MKRELNDILNELDENELDEALSGFGGDLLPRDESEAILKEACRRAGITGEKRKGSLRIGRRGWIALAACLALIIALGAGSFAYAADVREYNNAVAFFSENGLISEGLTRGDIKAVYRDIKTGVCTYSRTAEVLVRSERTDLVPGMSFPAQSERPSGSEQQAGLELHYASYSDSIRLRSWRNTRLVEGSNVSGSIFIDSYIEEYTGSGYEEKVLWRYTTDRMVIWSEKRVADGVLAIGTLPYDQANALSDIDADEPEEPGGEEFDLSLLRKKYTPAVMKLSKEGELIWFCSWDNGFDPGRNGERIDEIVENGDGTLTVFSSFYKTDADYNMTETKFIMGVIDEAGNYSLRSASDTEELIRARYAVPFGQGFIAVCDFTPSFTTGLPAEQRIVTVDPEGRLSEEFTYGENGLEYDLYDIEVFGGRLYVSAIACGELFERFVENGELVAEIPDEEFTEAVKECYTAVLLVCDTVGGAPELFYQVEGSCGYDLEISEGRLEWKVESIFSARFTPGLNSRTLDGKTKVYKYLFNEDGSFAEAVDTGMMSILWR